LVTEAVLLRTVTFPFSWGSSADGLEIAADPPWISGPDCGTALVLGLALEVFAFESIAGTKE
jgi:hypothetical protein